MPMLAVEMEVRSAESWALASSCAANHSAVVRMGARGDGIVIP
jgi:hypothetical protein